MVGDRVQDGLLGRSMSRKGKGTVDDTQTGGGSVNIDDGHVVDRYIGAFLGGTATQMLGAANGINQRVAPVCYHTIILSSPLCRLPDSRRPPP
jgi:hypothetical protein